MSRLHEYKTGKVQEKARIEKLRKQDEDTEKLFFKMGLKR